MLDECSSVGVAGDGIPSNYDQKETSTMTSLIYILLRLNHVLFNSVERKIKSFFKNVELQRKKIIVFITGVHCKNEMQKAILLKQHYMDWHEKDRRNCGVCFTSIISFVCFHILYHMPLLIIFFTKGVF